MKVILMKLLAVFGTRPEAIKLAPLIKQLKNDPFFELRVCVTAQHRQMLDQVLEMFEIKPEYDLNLMGEAQTLNEITAKILISLKEKVFTEFFPDGIIVHGDTATTFAGALSGFYEKIPIYHIEAGLRTGNLFAPWPEEANRVLVSVLTQKHFAPTQTAKLSLLKENIPSENILVTGNTVIDSLFQTLKMIQTNVSKKNLCETQFSFLDSSKKLILVTGHRRENFGTGFLNICEALREIAQRDDVQIVYPLHLNPNVRKPVLSILGGCKSIHLLEPLDYLPFIFLMSKAYLILTDSGGIQEEAPSLGIPVLVMRDVTERPEAVEAGTVKLVGTNKTKIINEATILLNHADEYKKMSLAHNPYGDGQACLRIAKEFKRMSTDKKQVCIVGLGYIGLPTAALFANEGMNVFGVDINPLVLKSLEKGEVHIVEPGLDVLVKSCVESKKLQVGREPISSDIFLIAVPTPINLDKSPDDSYVMSATHSIAPVLKKGDLIIIESTSPVGTTEKAIELLKIERPDLKFPKEGTQKEDVHVVYCPERVIPGHALREMKENDRIIGCFNEKSYQMAKNFYQVVVRGDCIKASVKAAEMSKLTENAFRDVNIAFSNELANIAEKLGIDPFELIDLANKHPRVNILQPGPGVGGHCIPIDPWFIVSQSKGQAKLMHQARLINDERPYSVLKKIKEAASHFQRPKVALLGLSFKADIDDLRESPAMTIAVNLAINEDFDLLLVEPYIKELPKAFQQENVRKVSLETAIEEGDVIVVLVEHAIFKASRPQISESQILIDTKGVWRHLRKQDNLFEQTSISFLNDKRLDEKNILEV